MADAVIKKKLKEYIAEHFSMSSDDISDTTNLYEEGIVDSIEVPGLIAFLEKEFKLTFIDNYFFDERFFYLDGLAEIIEEIKGNPC